MALQNSDFGLTEAQVAVFRAAVWDHYRREGRDLPWRRTRDPYAILVSEIMLQQTQVTRVRVKYGEFLALFPTFHSVAAAPVSAVLSAWSGLGYNRRALTLHRTAKVVVDVHGGRLPASLHDLCRLPGVGYATAAAVSAFAFERAHPFIETNIRSAFIHHFFPGEVAVGDADILPLVAKTMDLADPRGWFYALMDYGVWVKKTFGNPSRRSRHHAVQSPFAGSRRQIRAQVLRALLSVAPASAAAVTVVTMLPSRPPLDEVASVLDELAEEGFLEKEDERYRVA
jgi:A/G-specific adenine glycosylase